MPRKHTLVNYDAAPEGTPTVEHHLQQISAALALVTVLHRALSTSDDLCLGEDLTSEASAKVTDLCEEAWLSAKELYDALPATTGNMHIVCNDDEGGAR